MAALQKIRNRGALLIVVIGLAMFAFIAGDLFNSIETVFNSKRMQVGEVCGEGLSVQDYQAMVEEATQISRLGAEIDDQAVRDGVWEEFIVKTIVQEEAGELGLVVTDGEVQNALRKGTSQSLCNSPFVNPETGRFELAMLQNFLTEYKNMSANVATMPADQVEQLQTIYNLWIYAEKNLRNELLMEKYNTLLLSTFTSNPVCAKMYIEGNVAKSQTELAIVPFTAVADSLVPVTDADLKATYNKNKELFISPVPSRDIKYIDVTITASAADRAELNANMAKFHERLLTEDAAAVVNNSRSEVPYVDLALTKGAFPVDVQNVLDTLKVGKVTMPYFNGADNTMNIVKLIGKAELPDSILFRAIGVGGATADEVAQRADSVEKALRAGASFASVAKIYDQPSDSSWMVVSRYEAFAPNSAYLKNLMATSVNGFGQTDIEGGGKLVFQVLDRKAMKTKYNAAVVKREVTFSPTTREEARNKFNRFVAENRTLEDIEKNAVQNGYIVRPLNGIHAVGEEIANVKVDRDLIRWIFDEAEVGSISKINECGQEKDHLLLVAVSATYDKGYFAMEDSQVKEILTAMAKAEKKGAYLLERAKDVKDMAAAKALEGAVVDTLDINFGQPPYVMAAMSNEWCLSGLAAKTEAGKTSAPVAGKSGLYVANVISKPAPAMPFTEKEMLNQAAQYYTTLAMRPLLNELRLKADIVDNRYKF